eukprot:1148648-Pelagomonas_calceolata.AAC.3
MLRRGLVATSLWQRGAKLECCGRRFLTEAHAAQGIEHFGLEFMNLWQKEGNLEPCDGGLLTKVHNLQGFGRCQPVAQGRKGRRLWRLVMHANMGPVGNAFPSCTLCLQICYHSTCHAIANPIIPHIPHSQVLEPGASSKPPDPHQPSLFFSFVVEETYSSSEPMCLLF